MQSAIRIRVMNMNGTVEAVDADPLATLVEVIGVDRLADSLVFENGRRVNTYMTLSHENIRDGSLLLLARPRPSPRRILRDGLETAVWWEERRYREHQAAEARERARITDMIWAGWEMSSGHDRMCAAMRERAASRAGDGLAAKAESLDITPRAKIAEDPLPMSAEMGREAGIAQQLRRLKEMLQRRASRKRKENWIGVVSAALKFLSRAIGEMNVRSPPERVNVSFRVEIAPTRTASPFPQLGLFRSRTIA